MSRAVLEEKVYTFKWDKDSTRKARIVFMFNGTEWVFSKCIYETMYAVYDLDDWEFIRDLAGEVIRLRDN